MHFTGLDLWLCPCSYIFQGQLSCFIFNTSDRILRYVWHWRWEVMRKEFLQKKGAENHPSSHCFVQRRKGWEGMPRAERRCSSPRRTSWDSTALRLCTSTPARAYSGFREVGFFSSTEKLPQTSFFVCLFVFLTSLWINTVFLTKKKSLPGKQHRYKGSWTHQSNMQKGTEWASPTPHISVTRGGGGRLKPQPQGTENKPKTVLKRALPILCPHLSPSFSVRTMKHHLSIWRVKSTV